MGSLAERLRTAPRKGCLAMSLYEAATGEEIACPDSKVCFECWDRLKDVLADAVEAERRKTEHGGAIPDGVIWPRFEGGELVRFGDKFVAGESGNTYEVVGIKFHNNGEFSLTAPNGSPCCFYSPRFRNGTPVKRPEPEVLDADGVPIKVGDTVYYTQPSAYTEGERIVDTIVGKEVCFTNGYWANPAHLTHRKPDSMEALWQDAEDFVNHLGDGRNATYVFTLLKRQSKLLGGE